MKASALALAILLVGSGCSAKADDPAPEDPVLVASALPDRPDSPVLDEAEILPDDEEAELAKRLTDYWERNRTAVIVATVDTLGGEEIDDYSLRLAREWNIGDSETYRGLLVLVAPNERRVRIEVSCGLEPIITDVFAGQVIRERMTPLFRDGSLDAGTLAGVDALIARLDESAGAPPDMSACVHLKEAA